MLAFRAAASDTQPAGNQVFVTVPVPTGTLDGDLLVAVLGLAGGASVTLTAPAGWTRRALVPNEDGTHPCTAHVYTHEARNEPAHWIWTASVAGPHSGVMAAYSGADRYTVIDAQAAQVTVPAVNHPVPTLVTSEHGTIAIACFAAGVLTTANAPSGWTRRALATHAQGGVETLAAIVDRTVPAPTTTAAATITTAAAGPSSCATVAVLPSPGVASSDEVREELIDILPPGTRDLYELAPDNADGFGPLLQGDADFVRLEAHHVRDVLAAEVTPQRARLFLPRWEEATGQLAGSLTVPQRRANVAARVRESGASTRDNIRTVIGTLLGYANPLAVTIVECPRATLTAAHDFYNGTGGFLGAPGSTAQTVAVGDQPHVSGAGAKLIVNVPSPTAPLADVSIRLQGPASITYPQADVTWTFADRTALDDPMIFYAPTAAGCEIQGTWTVTFTVAGAATMGWDSWDLQVEGTGRSTFGAPDGWGAAIYRWVVAYDTALCGAVNAPDYAEARRALQRLKPAHTEAYLVDIATAVFDVARFEAAVFV